MTKRALRLEDGKIAILNTAYDYCLWSGHWVANREQNRFNEIYVHKTKGGKLIFYEVFVTFWVGEENHIRVLTRANVRDWFIDHYQKLGKGDLEDFAKYGITIQETA